MSRITIEIIKDTLIKNEIKLAPTHKQLYVPVIK